MSMNEIESMLKAEVSMKEKENRWEWVAGFNYAASLLKPQISSRDAVIVYERKYRLLMGVRSRIERLEALFKAKDLLAGKKSNRVDTWLTIFDLGKNRMITDLKNKIIECGMTTEEFCDAVGIIYGDFSDRAAHSVPLPKEIRDADITEVVRLLEVDDDEPIEKTLIILVKKLKLVNKLIVEEDGSTSSVSGISFEEEDANKTDGENLEE